MLPQGAKVISSSVGGGSSFSSTGRLVVQLSDGTTKQYFMKVYCYVQPVAHFSLGAEIMQQSCSEANMYTPLPITQTRNPCERFLEQSQVSVRRPSAKVPLPHLRVIFSSVLSITSLHLQTPKQWQQNSRSCTYIRLLMENSDFTFQPAAVRRKCQTIGKRHGRSSSQNIVFRRFWTMTGDITVPMLRWRNSADNVLSKLSHGY